MIFLVSLIIIDRIQVTNATLVKKIFAKVVKKKAYSGLETIFFFIAFYAMLSAA